MESFEYCEKCDMKKKDWLNQPTNMDEPYAQALLEACRNIVNGSGNITVPSSAPVRGTPASGPTTHPALTDPPWYANSNKPYPSIADPKKITGVSRGALPSTNLPTNNKPLSAQDIADAAKRLMSPSGTDVTDNHNHLDALRDMYEDESTSDNNPFAGYFPIPEIDSEDEDDTTD